MLWKRSISILLLLASAGTATVGTLQAKGKFSAFTLQYPAAITFALAALAVLLMAWSGIATTPKAHPEPHTEGSPAPKRERRSKTPAKLAGGEAGTVQVAPVATHEGVAAPTHEDPSIGITDPQTGMMNHLFFAGLIGTKVATARRRLWPVSVALLQVSLSNEIASREQENLAISEFAETVKTTLRDADVACRVSARTFALILDDTDEDGAAWASERIQLAQARKLDTRIIKVSAGIASYPSHGIEAAEILNKSREALERATANADLPGLGLVIVAPQKPL